MKWSQIKEKAEKHYAEMYIVSIPLIGAVGWVLAGIYAQKLANVYEFNPDNMLDFEVPDVLKEIREEGGVLQYWVNSDGSEEMTLSGHNNNPITFPVRY